MRTTPFTLVARVMLVAGFGLSVFAQIAEAKPSIITLASSAERGNFVSISAGAKWKLKSVVFEVGVKSKKTIKWSRVGTARTDRNGRAAICSSKVLRAGSQMRLKSGRAIIALVKVSRSLQLSGCGYVPKAPTTTLAPASPAITTSSPTPTTPATTPATIIAPFTAAPSALALSVATDTGDSSSDGITKATNLVIEGIAEATSSVQVYVDGVSSGTTCTAGNTGAFSCALGTVTEGTKSVTAKAAGINGESVISGELALLVDRTSPTVSFTPNGNFWIGANDRMQISVTTSEITTNLISSDIRVVCSIPDGCAAQNFVGSGRNYSFDFATIDNFTNGGAIGFLAGVFSDVAGNGNVASSGPTIMYDSDGPRPTLSTENGLIIITFSEIPIEFSQNNLSLIGYLLGVRRPDPNPGAGINNFGTYGTSGKSWRFTVNDNFRIVDEDEYYLLEVGPLKDVDGNFSQTVELAWP